MKFLADENIPLKSIIWLRDNKIDIASVQEQKSGMSDLQVLELANKENRTILTLDSDFGTLIFKLKLKAKAGVVFFRLSNFQPVDLSLLLLKLIEDKEEFKNSIIVIDSNSIRKRKF